MKNKHIVLDKLMPAALVTIVRHKGAAPQIEFNQHGQYYTVVFPERRKSIPATRVMVHATEISLDMPTNDKFVIISVPVGQPFHLREGNDNWVLVFNRLQSDR